MSSKRKSTPLRIGTRDRRIRMLALLLVPALVAIAYGNTLRAPFAYDDRVHILENPLVTSFAGIVDLPAMIRVFNTPSGVVGRPLLVMTYGMNYASSGPNPEAFRRVNLLIHTVNSLLVFLTVLELANSLGSDRDRNFWLALLAAAFFASHPLATESVTYIAGRSSSFCATFYIAGLYATLKAGREISRRRWLLLLLTGVLTGIGLLVKQDANTLPLACVALVWLAWPSVVSNRDRWMSTEFLGFVMLFTLAAQFNGLVDVSQNTQNNYALVAAGFETTLPFVTYVLTSIAGFSGYYLWRFLVPVRLNVDPDVRTVTTVTSFGFLISLIVLLGLALLAFWFRRRKPLVATGIGLILVSPLSAYCVFPLADVIAEHRAYIPLLGVVTILADIVFMFPKTAAISLCLVAVYTWMSVERNEVWSDEVLLWEDASRQTPAKIRPHLNLGALYQAGGQGDRAIQEYEIVLAREPEHSGALANLASIYLERSNLGQAEELLNRAIALKSTFPAVYLNLGVVRLRQGRLKEAGKLLEHAITLNPNQLMAHLDLGDVLFNQGQPARAIQEYLSEIKLNRNFEMAHLHLAVAYEVSGMRQKAVEEYQIVAKLNPANPQVRPALDRLK